jgi:hypothetical protein
MIPTPNTVISGSARDKEVLETTQNGEASSSRSLGREERNEDEEDEPRQPRFRSLNDIVRPFFARSAPPLGDGMRKKYTEIPPKRASV